MAITTFRGVIVSYVTLAQVIYRVCVCERAKRWRAEQANIQSTLSTKHHEENELS